MKDKNVNVEQIKQIIQNLKIEILEKEELIDELLKKICNHNDSDYFEDDN